MKKDITLEEILERHKRFRRRLKIYLVLFSLMVPVYFFSDAHPYWMGKFQKPEMKASEEPQIPYEVPFDIESIRLVQSGSTKGELIGNFLQVDLKSREDQTPVKLLIDTDDDGKRWWNPARTKIPEWEYFQKKLANCLVWFERDGEFRTFRLPLKCPEPGEHVIVTNLIIKWVKEDDEETLFVRCWPNYLEWHVVSELS